MCLNICNRILLTSGLLHFLPSGKYGLYTAQLKCMNFHMEREQTVKIEIN